MESEQL